MTLHQINDQDDCPPKMLILSEKTEDPLRYYMNNVVSLPGHGGRVCKIDRILSLFCLSLGAPDFLRLCPFFNETIKLFLNNVR